MDNRVNKHPVERIYPNDDRVKPQTIAHHVARYSLAISLKKPMGIAVDLGCGSGYGSNMLKQAGYTVWGVDRSGEAITYAKKNYQVDFDVIDLGNIVFESKANSLITMFEVLEHLTRLKGLSLLSKISRGLKPGGIFIMSVPRDINPKNNGFHKSKWTYGMLKRELSTRFLSVEIIGQDWDTVKFSEENVKENDFYIAICKND